MLTLLHAADIHLDSLLQSLERCAGAHLAAARQASRLAFENLVQLALKNVMALHVQRFAARAVTRDLSPDYPWAVAGACNIGLLHTCAGGREGHAPCAPCTLDGLRTGLRRP